MSGSNKLSAPIDVCISVTKRCNLRCKHCCTNVDLKRNELPLEKFIDILDQLKRAKVFKVQIIGGEPFVRKDIFTILRAVKERRFALTLNTNCTLIDDRIIKELKSIGLAGLGTSLDGSCAEIHDRLRGDGAFDAAVRGIKKLIANGIRVIAEAVVTKLNIDDLPEIARTARRIGIDYLVFVPISHGKQVQCFLSEIAPDEEVYGKGIAVVQKLKADFGDYVGGPFLQGYDLIQKYRSLPVGEGQSAKTLYACGAGRQNAGIRSDGEVIPCSGLWDMTCGSLLKQSFIDIWNNSPILEKFRRINTVSLDSIEQCRACRFKYFCTGNCRGSAFYYSGSITGFSPDCRYYEELKKR